jgi:hypothetical protein
MLKADIATSSKFLQQLFNNIWNNEIIPSDWTKDLIIMLPIKGDIQICDNWRGFNIRLYDKNCESDYVFFLHQNFFQQHWESEYFFRKKTITPSPLSS